MVMIIIVAVTLGRETLAFKVHVYICIYMYVCIYIYIYIYIQ